MSNVNDYLPRSPVQTQKALLDALRPLGQALGSGVLNRQVYRHGFMGLLREHLNCSRVSLWRFHDQDKRLICRASVEAAGHDLMHGSELTHAQYRAYFERLMQLGVFACTDTRTEPIMADLRGPVFDPQNVRALLDVSFGINGRLYGVLCCEQMGESREWTREEATTLQRVARLTSLQVARVIRGSAGEAGLAARDLMD